MTSQPPTITCPRERFPTHQAALDELIVRTARATLAGSPIHLTATPCTDCGGAHIRRTPTTGTTADSTGDTA